LLLDFRDNKYLNMTLSFRGKEMSSEGLDEPLVVRVNSYAARASSGMLSAAGAQIIMAPGPIDESRYQNSGQTGGNQVTYSSERGIYISTMRTPNGAEDQTEPVSQIKLSEKPLLIVNLTEDPLSVIDEHLGSFYADELTFSIKGASLAAETIRRLRQESPFSADVDTDEIHANRKLNNQYGIHVLLPQAWDNLVGALEE